MNILYGSQSGNKYLNPASVTPSEINDDRDTCLKFLYRYCGSDGALLLHKPMEHKPMEVETDNGDFLYSCRS